MATIQMAKINIPLIRIKGSGLWVPQICSSETLCCIKIRSFLLYPDPRIQIGVSDVHQKIGQ
jgi:hypothetical protein